MKQFKVGDTVRLKKNLKVGEYYNDFELFDAMVFKESTKITRVYSYDVVEIEATTFMYPFEMLVKEKP